MTFGAPQHLRVVVQQADRSKDGKPVFVIALELDGHKWTVVRRERDVIELHAALVKLMRFVPDPPVSERRWLWRAAEQLGTLQLRLQDFLVELTCNGQWVWDEAAVLRQFLQVPVQSVGVQARGVLLGDIKSHGLRRTRSQMLDDIRSGRASSSLRRASSKEGAVKEASSPRSVSRQRAASAAAAVLAPTSPAAAAFEHGPPGAPPDHAVARRRFSGAL